MEHLLSLQQSMAMHAQIAKRRAEQRTKGRTCEASVLREVVQILLLRGPCSTGLHERQVQQLYP